MARRRRGAKQTPSGRLNYSETLRVGRPDHRSNGKDEKMKVSGRRIGAPTCCKHESLDTDCWHLTSLRYILTPHTSAHTHIHTHTYIDANCTKNNTKINYTVIHPFTKPSVHSSIRHYIPLCTHPDILPSVHPSFNLSASDPLHHHRGIRDLQCAPLIDASV